MNFQKRNQERLVVLSRSRRACASRETPCSAKAASVCESTPGLGFRETALALRFAALRADPSAALRMTPKEIRHVLDLLANSGQVLRLRERMTSEEIRHVLDLLALRADSSAAREDDTVVTDFGCKSSLSAMGALKRPLRMSRCMD